MKIIGKLTYLCLLILVSCTSEELNSSSYFTEGEAVTITLKFDVPQISITTRATSPLTDEYKVNNLYVFVFNADGSKASGQHFDYKDLQEKQENGVNGATQTQGYIRIKTVSGKKKQIYGIANINNSMMNLTETELQGINHLSELKKLTARLKQQTTSRGTSFLMSGTTDSPIDIPHAASTETPVASIWLQRVDAKVTFKIKTADGVTFTPREWKVVNASQLVSVIPGDSDPESADDENGYFETAGNNFEGENEEFGKTFSFYILENRKIPRKTIPNTGSPYEQYACREKQEKISIPGLPEGEYPEGKPGHSVTNGAYEYAHANSTYIVMSGHIRYPYGTNGQEVSADVVYTIHLGYLNNNPNDYNTPRNSYYTYQVTIENAESIILEVENGTEKQPGAEGNVTIAQKIFDLDAHYVTKMINFSYNQIDESLTWYVNTPFSEGVPSENSTPQDYKWIKFLLNTKNGSAYSQDFGTYPGANANFEADVAFNKIDHTKLIDVIQLVRILKENKQKALVNGSGNYAGTLFDGGGNITFTAFINENYYETDPRTEETARTDFWKKFVNRPQRVMNILSQTRYSPDGESVKTVAVVSFRQKSIQTMYNINAGAGLQSAWGTEVIQETEERPFWKESVETGWSSTTPPYNDPSNGRSNTLKLWGNGQWTTFINTANNSMQTDYNYARYNCMQRNRDINGNGTIDADEIRWYLASINQLTDLWIGENSFDQEARLFKGSEWTEDFYVSSTVPTRYQNGGILGSKKYWDNPTILWSSEGSSIGDMNSATDYTSTMNFNYRCVRNLGITDVPQDFAQYSGGKMSLEYLDQKSIRAYSQSEELPEHHERQADNLPWWKFEVNTNCSGSNMNWIEVRTAINTNNSPCPSGYRVPNQRELALMLSRVGNDGHWTLDNHMSRTRFSMNPSGGTRYGFSVNQQAGILYLINNNNERGGVRCVRDLPK